MSAVSLDELYTPTAVAERLPAWSAVDETALTTFAEQGYLVIERAFDAATVTAAQAAIDSLMMRPDTRRCLQFEPTAPGDLAEADLATKRTWIRKLMWFVEHDARLGDMARDPALVATLSRLMGEPPVLFQDMALLKPAGVGSEKPWHQGCRCHSHSICVTCPLVRVARQPRARRRAETWPGSSASSSSASSARLAGSVMGRAAWRCVSRRRVSSSSRGRRRASSSARVVVALPR